MGATAMVIRLENLALPDTYPAASAITIRDGHIVAAGEVGAGAVDLRLDFGEVLGSVAGGGGAFAFPGLVNAHDHLEFDLFPPLGGAGLYADYLDWGHDIQRRHRDVIREVLRIPRDLRYRWGIYKNLLAGVTTVVHHGSPLPGEVAGPPAADPLIRVVDAYLYLHSLGFDRRWWLRLVRRGRRGPVLVHIAEGSGPQMAAEPDRLHRFNLWGADLIGIHAIAMNEQQARRWKAVIWCPVSNLFLYGRTAPVHALKASTTVLFGTDSTVSAGWDIWEHLRVARQMGGLRDGELYACLNAEPARVFGLPGRIDLAPGAPADLVVAQRRGGGGATGVDTFFDAFFAVEPRDLLLVVRGGRILLWDARLRLAGGGGREPYDPVQVGERTKLVAGGIVDLVRAIRAHGGGATLPIAVDGAGPGH